MIGNLVQNIFRLLDPSRKDAVKQHALNTVNMLLLTRAPFISENTESYMKHIVGMYQSATSTMVKLRIIQGLVTIADFELDIIVKEENFPIIAQLMLTALSQHTDAESERIA